MNIATFLVLALVVLAVVLSIRSVRRKGTCSCRDCHCHDCKKRR